MDPSSHTWRMWALFGSLGLVATLVAMVVLFNRTDGGSEIPAQRAGVGPAQQPQPQPTTAAAVAAPAATGATAAPASPASPTAAASPTAPTGGQPLSLTPDGGQPTAHSPVPGALPVGPPAGSPPDTSQPSQPGKVDTTTTPVLGLVAAPLVGLGLFLLLQRSNRRRASAST